MTMIRRMDAVRRAASSMACCQQQLWFSLFENYGRKDAAMFIQETKLRAGFKYLYGYNHPYSIKDKKINLEGYIPSSRKEKRIENTRTTDMQFELRAFLNDAQVPMEVRAMGKNDSKYCPFTGGEDIEIYPAKRNSAAAVISHEEVDREATLEEEEEDREATPEEEVTTPPKRM